MPFSQKQEGCEIWRHIIAKKPAYRRRPSRISTFHLEIVTISPTNKTRSKALTQNLIRHIFIPDIAEASFEKHLTVERYHSTHYQSQHIARMVPSFAPKPGKLSFSLFLWMFNSSYRPGDSVR
jgi:hypothetical protein